MGDLRTARLQQVPREGGTRAAGGVICMLVCIGRDRDDIDPGDIPGEHGAPVFELRSFAE